MASTASAAQGSAAALASGAEATTNEAREFCHAKRDLYYACAGESKMRPFACDSAEIHTHCISAEDKSADCKGLRSQYSDACLASWVKYWDERVRRGLPLKVGVK